MPDLYENLCARANKPVLDLGWAGAQHRKRGICSSMGVLACPCSTSTVKFELNHLVRIKKKPLMLGRGK